MTDRSTGMLEGKVAVITGAGQGLGKVMARVFAREGAKVLAADVSGAEEATAAEIGSPVVPFHADVGREPEIEAMFDHALQTFGRVDALVNNAATLASYRPEFTAEEFEELTAVNLRGLLFCCKHGIRAMLQGGGGSIVNVTTAGAIDAAEEQASVVYSAAKAGVNSVTKSLAIHYGARGIRVNSLAPGLTWTERTHGFPQEWIDHASRKAAMGRLGEMEEQANVAAFLASDLSSFVTGTVIPVDGGWTARLA
jgi:NAD(P)-dependent dehydrogenase (short-subunit alcohol dehydrogenase family)